jgi:hypothetical protein
MDNPDETGYRNVGRPCSCRCIRGMKGKQKSPYSKLDEMREEEGYHPDN